MSARATSTDLETIFAAPPPPSDGSCLRLVGRLCETPPHSYAGFTPDGNAVVIVPLATQSDAPARVTCGLSFRAARDIEFRFEGTTWHEAAAILECQDPSLTRTFSVLAASLVDRLHAGAKPTWHRVVASFEEWEKLLRRKRLLLPEEELGLWGELSIVATSQRLDDLVAGWRGPEADHVDFFLENYGFEVKATRRPGIYFVSHGQVVVPDENVLFIAIEVCLDPVLGRTLLEVVDDIAERCADPCTFERQLLEAGFSRSDSAAYSRRYAWRRPPQFYPREAIPRVRVADPGVTQLRYRIELDPSNALEGDNLRTLAGVVGLLDHV